MAERSDPLWAARAGKRLLKLAVVLTLAVALLWVAWLFLPESEPEFRLELTTDMHVFAGGISQGTGSIVLDTDALMAVGTPVPLDVEMKAIASTLFPGFEFHGTAGISSATLWRSGGGIELFVLSPEGVMLVRRLFLFRLSNEWLAVALEFRHPEHARTRAIAETLSFGWSLMRSLSKQYFEERTAKVIGVSGDLPGPDEMHFTSQIPIR